jgi:hypothetical protein
MEIGGGLKPTTQTNKLKHLELLESLQTYKTEIVCDQLSYLATYISQSPFIPQKIYYTQNNRINLYFLKHKYLFQETNRTRAIIQKVKDSRIPLFFRYLYNMSRSVTFYDIMVVKIGSLAKYHS